VDLTTLQLIIGIIGIIVGIGTIIVGVTGTATTIFDLLRREGHIKGDISKLFSKKRPARVRAEEHSKDYSVEYAKTEPVPESYPRIRESGGYLRNALTSLASFFKTPPKFIRRTKVFLGIAGIAIIAPILIIIGVILVTNILSSSYSPIKTSSVPITEKETPVISDSKPENTEAELPGRREGLDPLGFKMVTIPGGSFIMGSDHNYSVFNNADPAHEVEVSDFYISETEVTNAQYVAFLNGEKPSQEGRVKWILINGDVTLSETIDNTHIIYLNGEYSVEKGWEEHPVGNVSWFGAMAFCEFYGFTLPTEAEWEYAAGGPGHSMYPWGNSYIGEKACCCSNNNPTADPGTMPVRSFKPNGYGLYDMAGNVSEWCLDIFAYYPGSISTTEFYGDTKVVRNGSWRDSYGYMVTAQGENTLGWRDEFLCIYRKGYIPAFNSPCIGFRCADK